MKNDKVHARLITNGSRGREEREYRGEMGYVGLVGWLERTTKAIEGYPEVQKILGRCE